MRYMRRVKVGTVHSFDFDKTYYDRVGLWPVNIFVHTGSMSRALVTYN